MKIKKIKDLRKFGNRKPKTEKQLEAHKKSGFLIMTTKNPMWNKESKKKNIERRKGKIFSPETLFKKGNQYGRLRKNRKISDEQRLRLSLKKIGKPIPHLKKHQFKKGRVPHNKMDIDLKILKQLKSQEKTIGELAKYFDCSKNTIWDRLKKLKGGLK